MENLKKYSLINTEKIAHKSRCSECPAYNGCMGIWLDYFGGKEYFEQ